MADKFTQLLLAALGKAVLAPAGMPLHASKTVAGLFPATAAGKSAAQKARDEGLITENAGAFVATPRGLAFLEENTSSKQVLDDLTRAVEARREQVDDLIAAATQMNAELGAIQGILGRLCVREASANSQPRAAETPATWLDDARSALAVWPSGTAGDMPLPALYKHLAEGRAGLTVGQFHDGLRRLHDAEEVYLHPWTGPLYALPEPVFALMIGHEIAYYASPRPNGNWAADNDRGRRTEALGSTERLTAVH